MCRRSMRRSGSALNLEDRAQSKLSIVGLGDEQVFNIDSQRSRFAEKGGDDQFKPDRGAAVVGVQAVDGFGDGEDRPPDD